MEDFEPINIEFLINNPQVIADAKIAEATLQDVNVKTNQSAAEASKAVASTIKQNFNIVATEAKATLEAQKLQLAEITLQRDITPHGNVNQLISYNQQIEQLKANIAAASNIGKSDFDQFGERIVNNTSKIDAAITRVTSLQTVGARVITQLGRQVIGLGVGVLSGIFGAKAIEALVTYIANLDIFKEKVTEATLKQQDYNAALSSSEYTTAIKNVNQLTIDVELAKEGFLDKTKVLHEYNRELGASLGYADSLDQAEQLLVKNGKAYIQMTLLKAAAQLALQDSAKKAFESAQKHNETPETDFHVSDIFHLFSSNDDVKEEQKFDDERRKRLNTDRDQEAADIQKQSDQQLDIYKDFTTKAAKIAKDNHLDFFDGTEDEKKHGLHEKVDASIAESKALLAAQTTLLENVDALKNKYASKEKTKNEQQQDEVIATYTKQYDAIVAFNVKRQNFIDKFNKTHKNKDGEAYANKIGLKKQDPSEIQYSEHGALEALSGTQSVEQTKIEIDEEKNLFKEYQDYKLKAGTTAANELYGSQLKGFTSYLDYLKSLQPTEAELTSADPYVKARANTLADLLKKEIPAATQQLQSQTAAQLSQYLLETITFEQKKAAVIEQYEAKADLLRKNHRDQQAYDAELEGEAQLDLININQQKQIDSYKGLAASIETIAAEQAALRIQEARATAAADLASGKISEEAYRSIIALIDQANANIKANTIAQGFGELSAVFNQLSQSISGLDNNLSGTIKTFADFFTQVQSLITNIPKLEDAIKNYQKTKDAASGSTGSSFLGAISAVASVIPVAGAIINAGIQVVSGVVNFFKAASETAKASAEELIAYQSNLIVNQIAYNEHLREQVRNQQDIATLTGQELEDRKALLALQLQAAQADFNTLLAQGEATGKQITGEHTEKYGGFLGIGKKTKVVQDTAGIEGLTYDQLNELDIENKLDAPTKAWFESLTKSKDEIDAINKAAKDAADQTDKIFTATTASSISDAIIEGFKNGKRTAADFADDFQSLMQNAALSVFQNNYLNAKIADFYKQFADASEKNGGLTETDIANLKETYSNIITDSNAQLADLEKVVGPIKSKTSSNSLSGAISGITADQANLLAGQFGGLRLTQLETNQILTQTMGNSLAEMKNQTLLQMQIVANTGRTADNTDKMKISLQNIDNNTSASNLTEVLRAAGIS